MQRLNVCEVQEFGVTTYFAFQSISWAIIAKQKCAKMEQEPSRRCNEETVEIPPSFLFKSLP